MDESTTVADLKKAVAAFRDARDWAQFHTPKDLAVSIAIEAAELMELFQWKSTEDARVFLQTEAGGKRLREELADVVIYALSLSDALGVDVAQAVRTKLAENDQKYPVERSRGSSAKYTDLGVDSA